MDVLQRLDAVIQGLCNCGQPPTPTYEPYCSEACADEPTHRAVHTDESESGPYSTPMRWRPDLVTAVDDSDLVQLTGIPGECPGYTGRFTANIYRRGCAGDRVWHLRLDNGHRFVGCDLNDIPDEALTEVDIPPGDFLSLLQATWRRLERELTDQRRTGPDPWADVTDRWLLAAHAIQQAAGEGIELQRRCSHCSELAVPTPGVRVIDGHLEQCDTCPRCLLSFPGPALEIDRTLNHRSDLVQFRLRIGDRKAGWRVFEEELHRHRDPEWFIRRSLQRLEQQLTVDYAQHHSARPDVIAWVQARREQTRRQMTEQAEIIRRMMEGVASAARRFVEAISPAAAEVNRLLASANVVTEQPEPAHPLARVNAQRRNQTHGPRQPQRPPRRIRPNGR